MRNFSTVSAAVLLSIMISIPGQIAAQSTETTEPETDETPNWTFSYAGISIGATRSDVDWVDNAGGYYSFLPGYGFGAEDNRATFGLHAGQWYERPGNFALGWEVAYSRHDHETSDISTLFPFSDTWDTRMKQSVSLVGKIGIINGPWLPYIEAGLAYGEIGFTNTDQLCFPTPCSFGGDGWHPGYVLGIGADYKANENVLIGINYRYTKYRDETYSGTNVSPTGNENYDLGAKSGTLSLRISYIF